MDLLYSEQNFLKGREKFEKVYQENLWLLTFDVTDSFFFPEMPDILLFSQLLTIDCKNYSYFSLNRLNHSYITSSVVFSSNTTITF